MCGWGGWDETPGGSRAAACGRETALLLPPAAPTTAPCHVWQTPPQPTARRLTFDEFCTALRLVAFRKQLPLERVVARVVGSLGPALNDTTTPDAVRLYDDLSTWTGALADCTGGSVGTAIWWKLRAAGACLPLFCCGGSRPLAWPEPYPAQH